MSMAKFSSLVSRVLMMTTKKTKQDKTKQNKKTNERKQWLHETSLLPATALTFNCRKGKRFDHNN